MSKSANRWMAESIGDAHALVDEVHEPHGAHQQKLKVLKEAWFFALNLVAHKLAHPCHKNHHPRGAQALRVPSVTPCGSRVLPTMAHLEAANTRAGCRRGRRRPTLHALTPYGSQRLLVADLGLP